MPQRIVISDCSMLTSVGLSAAEVAASTRSRTARLAEIAWRDDRVRPYLAGVVPEDGIAELVPELQGTPMAQRETRMLRLAGTALQKVTSQLGELPQRPPLFLGLPELHAAQPIDSERFIHRLAQQAGAMFDAAQSRPLPCGRAAGLVAVQAACEELRKGTTPVCIAGGVDSYLDLHLLATLAKAERLRSEVVSDGFIPGEGAGFVALCTEEFAQKSKSKALAAMAGCSLGHEAGHVYSEEPYRGDGLAKTLESLFNAADDKAPVQCVYCSFNGERYWAKELGVAVLRKKDSFAPDYRMEHPAECFGDLGAAHGSVMLGLAAIGISRGYRPAPTLVYSSSDLGSRAAVLVVAA